MLKLTNDELSKLSELCANNIGKLFDYFDLDYRGESRIYRNCCIHEGDNKNALNIYLHGNSMPFYYKCRTHGCEKVFQPTILGFVRAMLSVKKFRWHKPGDQTESFQNTLKFVFDFLDIDYKTIKISDQTAANNTFVRMVSLPIHSSAKQSKITRATIRKHLILPSEYYLNRGFSREILDRFDVGNCINPSKEMFNRAVFPIYDENHKYLLGCVGRSILNKCERCSFYHDGNCPTGYFNKFSKWRNHGFESGQNLFNYWFAKDNIKHTHTAIIVESPGNVLKLTEAEVKNVVGLYGTNFSDVQQILLEKLGVMNIRCIFDNDEAGQLAKDNLYKRCKNFFNIEFIEFDKKYNDIAECSTGEIKNLCL